MALANFKSEKKKEIKEKVIPILGTFITLTFVAIFTSSKFSVVKDGFNRSMNGLILWIHVI